MIVCSCNVLSCRQIKGTIAPDGTGPRTAGEAYDCLGCSPACGRCAREVRAILASVEIRARFAEIGGTAGEFSPDEYAAFVAAEVIRWAALVRESGAQPD